MNGGTVADEDGAAAATRALLRALDHVAPAEVAALGGVSRALRGAVAARPVLMGAVLDDALARDRTSARRRQRLAAAAAHPRWAAAVRHLPGLALPGAGITAPGLGAMCRASPGLRRLDLRGCSALSGDGYAAVGALSALTELRLGFRRQAPDAARDSVVDAIVRPMMDRQRPPEHRQAARAAGMAAVLSSQTGLVALTLQHLPAATAAIAAMTRLVTADLAGCIPPPPRARLSTSCAG